MPDCVTIPAAAVSHRLTPDKLRRAVRRRLPDLLAAGLVVKAAHHVLIPNDKVNALLDVLDEVPADDRDR